MTVSKLAGQRIAVFGLGRSGLGVARAVQALGGDAEVFDQQSRDALAKPELAKDAEREGIRLTFDWDGNLEPSSYEFLVANPAVDYRSPTIRRVQQAGLSVISEIEFAYRIAVAPIVGITGTNGKSTTTVMTYLCLMACGEEPILCGNIFGSGYPEKPLTEAALSAPSNQILVAEISSFQLDLADAFKPVSAAITNVTDDHLDRYDSFADYAAAKQKICRTQDENDTAVLPTSDPFTPEGPLVLRFGEPGSNAFAENGELDILGTTAKLSSMPFFEPHNALNAQTAGLLTYGALRSRARNEPASDAANLLDSAGASPYRDAGPCPKEVFDGLKRFRGLQHRMERVGEKNGVTVINNSMCTNPAAVVSSLQALGRDAHALIGGVNKEADFAPLASYLRGAHHKVYLFGRDAHQLNQVLGGDHPVFETMQQAFAAATSQAKANEVIILAPGCASHDQFSDFRQRGDVFRNVAKEWLRQ
jgi:UDP-N-acetylmuramoylalanine--D-glutamate ligase